MMSKKTYLYLIICSCLSANLFGQLQKMIRVQNCMLAKDVNCAQQAIDSVFLTKEAQTDAQAWYFRAFVYYELSKKDKNRIRSAYRDSSISYAKKSIAIQPEASNRDPNLEILKKHSSTYHNICKRYTEDSLNYKMSIEAYEKYKALYKLADPTFDFRTKDIEYYLAIGGQYAELYKDNPNPEYGEIGKIALAKVLELDPKNISASVNLGIIYYNQGVKLINSLDDDTPLEQLEVVLDNSAKLFKQSLPFMNKVYELDPKNVKALESLRQIYYSLNDEKKTLEFNEKLEKAKKGN